MPNKIKILLGTGLLIAGYFGRIYWLETHGYAVKPEAGKIEKAIPVPREILLAGEKTETAHYLVTSTATPQQTARVTEAVESLHSAYAEFFKDNIAVDEKPGKLKLMLYRNREEFSANNKSSSWAEAYYAAPVCYAYYSDKHPNPYHWMLHEATHQLNNEVAHFKAPKWINEGLASYFGSSKIENGKLLPGKIDNNTYPIWWLSGLSLSGNIRQDIDEGKIIPLRFIIENGGPDINQHVNLYYIEYWSFTHFLFHYKSGLYADSYKKLISEGGSLDDFEKTVGPLARIQSEWYDYLQQKMAETRPENSTRNDDAVEVSL